MIVMPSNIQELRTFNFADRHTIPGAVCCGWMDFHSDDGMGASEEDQYFEIEVLWVNEADNPLLVSTDDMESWKIAEPELGQVIRFNAYNPHALVPESFKNRLRTPESILMECLNKLRYLAEVPTSPKLVWNFLGD